MSKPIIRWLQITDLHVGKNNESQTTALKSLVASIIKHAGSIPFDVVFLSGDLAYSGSDSEYRVFYDEVVKPMREHSLFAGAEFIAAPGNHDLDCDIEMPPVWEKMGIYRQERFFHSNDEGRRIRGSRVNAFARYADFVERHAIYSANPLEAPAIYRKISNCAANVWIISVVTSYFSDKYVSDQRKAPAPVHSLRTALLEIPKEDAILVLGHHPLDWFTTESETQLRSLLIEHNAIYLHGHEHRVKTVFGHRGLISIGFGAAYQGPQDTIPKPFYRNSFAICELRTALHVSVTSWDCEHGLWRPDKNLSADFVDSSNELAEGYVLNLPTTRVQEHPRTHSSIAAAIRSELKFDEFFWLADDSPRRWATLLRSIGVFREPTDSYALPAQQLPVGHDQFRVRDATGSYLVRAVSASGDILNAEQLQSINTELDRQDYEGGVIVTLGEFSSDARTLATQLAMRKQLRVLERSDILREVVRSLPASLENEISHLSEGSSLSASIVFTSTGIAVLVREVGIDRRFLLLSESGSPFPESAETVSRLRSEILALRDIAYGLSTSNVVSKEALTQVVVFDKASYLRMSYEYFDDVRYAPLAALGFRFKAASLSEIYVEPTAHVGGSTKRSLALASAVTEFIESLNLPPAQREQLEAQFRSRHGLSATAEVGAARKLYQRYNNVLVLGDPGSGKTCFVKHEILAYCASPSSVDVTWYSKHLPVYVSLAEAARIVSDGTDIIGACEIVAARRGLQLHRSIIEESLANGTAAFFFDGLDEVGLLDKRISLLSSINELVKKFAHRGCRFVLTSRPAAIQPVDIPEALTHLQLNGLTEEEIRVLAGRVLANRLGSDPEHLGPEELQLIERLLVDAKLKPGIARIARNPLLLTLLVLIYANSGALSARRHVIYTQAIKTLVSVRGREVRKQQISEADLRTRLGALALSILRREIAEIPRRSEVLSVLAVQMGRGNSSSQSSELLHEADGYLQEVAEATGLLSIHSSGENNSDEFVTFMHYSFLEYYGAAGLLNGDYLEQVPRLAAIPRWRDVTTLLFGMLSEQADVTSLLERLVSGSSLAEDISGYRLLLSLDCANECDVPPEASQDLLADMTYEMVAHGAALYSADLRMEIAKRLESLLEGGGSRMERAIIRGLESGKSLVKAAFIDLIARIGGDCQLSPATIAAFRMCLADESPVTRTAAMHAVERREELRGPEVIGAVRKCLKGNLSEKHAALKVLGAVDAFSSDVRQELRDLLDDSNGLIAADAAYYVLADELRSGPGLDFGSLKEKALRTLERGSEDERRPTVGRLTLGRSELEVLLQSVDPRERELAVRYVPWLQGESAFVYRTLVEGLKNETASFLKTEYMNAIRVSTEAIALITIADTDYICSMLGDAERNVRIGAIKLLGEMPDDEQVVTSLQDHIKRLDLDSGDSSEVLETARALAKHARRNPKLRAAILQLVLGQLPRRAADGFGTESRQRNIESMLFVCDSLGGVADEAAWQLYRLATDFHTPIEIRKQALRVFGRLVEPTAKSASAIEKALSRNDTRLNAVTYSATVSFTIHCKQKVEFVRRVFASLPGIRDQLTNCWSREAAFAPESINPPTLSDIRDALVEVTNLITTYHEFAGRAVTSDSEESSPKQ